MNARTIDRIETNLERAASALLGGAVGYAAYTGLNIGMDQPQLAALAGAAGAVSGFLCRRALATLGRSKPSFPVAIFDVREIDAFDQMGELVLTDSDRLDNELLLTEADRFDHELLLTDADRVDRTSALVLDDILAELGPDSRVVRLFDRAAMPTPGQLKSRIDDHLAHGAPPAAPRDASQALSEALAELRRSLR